MSDPFDEIDLSEAGVRRRDEILRLALREEGRRRRRRATVLGWCAVLALWALLLISFPWRRDRPIARQPTPSNPQPLRSSSPIAPGGPNAVIVRIHTDPGLLDRLAIRPGKASWKTISDDQLLHELAEAGRPAGLEYGSRRQVMVLYR
jgi:hypothetical protein